ncbi:MAG: hypothetical protein KAH21_08370, partial [Spirochaetaceae bacterium]|nr:hypothetical protein [Spirochaetaceae bacterium]
MRADRRRIIQFILFLIVAINVDSAEKGPVYPGAVIEQKEWKVGISIFRSEKNDPALASAASLIPRLLQDEISGIG